MNIRSLGVEASKLLNPIWLAIAMLPLLMISACNTTPKTQPHTLPSDASVVGNWDGRLNCDRNRKFDVALSLWEIEQDKFNGNLVLRNLDTAVPPIEYAVLGSKHPYGSLIIEPDFRNYPNLYKDIPFTISFTGRLDPDTKKISGSIRTGCHAILRLSPVASVGVNQLAAKYGKYDAKTQKKKDKEQRLAQARTDCIENSKTNPGRVARYTGGSNFMLAPAFKGGLFVYKHTCLSAGTKEAAIIYSRTPPDDSGDTIEVFSGPFDKGTQISRRDVSILTMPQVCKIFDYSTVGGKRYHCTPYGWRYTDFVQRQCIGKAGAARTAPRALQCQLMVMGGTIQPFETLKTLINIVLLSMLIAGAGLYFYITKNGGSGPIPTEPLSISNEQFEGNEYYLKTVGDAKAIKSVTVLRDMPELLELAVTYHYDGSNGTEVSTCGGVIRMDRDYSREWSCAPTKLSEGENTAIYKIKLMDDMENDHYCTDGVVVNMYEHGKSRFVNHMLYYKKSWTYGRGFFAELKQLIYGMTKCR